MIHANGTETIFAVGSVLVALYVTMFFYILIVCGGIVKFIGECSLWTFFSNGRNLVENELIYENGKYRIDSEDFKLKITEYGVKLFILCSPHNPAVRVWTLAELRRLGDICRKHGVYVVSDESHCDFAFPEHPHHIFGEAVPEMAEQAIVCTAHSKTFDLAGP